ncbi:MAG: MFS transporter [Rickettsiales bacterium]|jgi:MFS family permease|nr:MFS transporter [Rickettsiales bacterium]
MLKKLKSFNAGTSPRSRGSNAGRRDRIALGLLKWSEALMFFMPILPVIVLVYQGKGVTLGEFFLIQGLFSVVAFLFEIPSGYLSDVFSRKKILVLGGLIQLAAMTWLIWAEGFWGVMAVEAMLGVASALFSGTKEAYVFDLLKRMKRENQYVKENGSVQTFTRAGTTIGTLVGGAIYAFSGSLLLAIEALSVLMAVGMLVWLPELREVRRKVAPESSPIKDCLAVVKMSVRHPEIKWLMIFPALYGGFTKLLMWVMQPMMEAALVPVALFGLFMGLNQGFRALFSKIAHRLLAFMGARRLMILCMATLAAGFMLVVAAIESAGHMALVYAITSVFAVIPAMQAMVALVMKNYVHHRIQSNERGTILSVNAMFSQIASGIVLMLAKPVIDGVGIEAAMFVCVAAAAVLLFPLKKVLEIKGIEK